MNEEAFAAAPDWALPEPGQVLVHPQGPAWAQAVKEGAERAAGWSFEVGGEPVGALRRRAREAALKVGRAMAARFGLADGAEAPAGYLVVTGHQPELVHPGIWIKNALVGVAADVLNGTWGGDDGPQARACDNGSALPVGVGLNVVVDSDTASDFGAFVPYARPDGRLGRRAVPLVTMRYGQPFSQVPPPDPDGWRRFAQDVRASLESVPAVGRMLVDRFDAFDQVASPSHLEEARHLAEWVTAARHRFEETTLPRPTRYLEVPLGELAQSEPFLRYFAHIALDAPRFASAYNQVLAAYRRAQRIRSRANPFPDLLQQDDRVEVPFWVLAPGVRRRKLYVRTGSGRLDLLTADGPLASIPLPPSPGHAGGEGPGPSRAAADAVVDFALEAGLQVRPRAVALTLFVRMLVADLFVHGVGGARYDRVCDALARLYFGAPLPRYAVASASLVLPLPHPAPTDPPAALRHRLHELRYNPQRFVDQLADAGARERCRRLAEEKQALIRAIQEPGAPKRELTRRIEAVNASLVEALAPVVSETEARLRQALEAEAARQAAVFRGYPFFLHDGVEVWRAALASVEGIRLSTRGGLSDRR